MLVFDRKICKFILSSAICLGLSLLATHALGAESLPVVVDGKPVATIVRNSEGGRVTALAVAELRDHIESITGVKLPVVGASAWDKSAEGGFLIVGQGSALDSLGFEIGDLPPEGYLIRNLPEARAVVLAGRDVGDPLATRASYRISQEFGSLYAVYELLEHWGVRWLFYGDSGTIIPKSQNLSVSILDKTDRPDFRMRNHWLRAYTPDGENIGRSDLRSTDPERKEVARQSILWALRNRAGNSLGVYIGGHHTPRWWTLWSESNPEYIGLYRGQRGIRRSPPGKQPDKLLGRSKLCVGNPEVANAVAELAIEAFRKSPATLAYSVCEQDGSPGFCECPLCMALDVYKEGETVQTTPLTDRYVNFWNRVAEKVSEEFDDRYLGVYLYSRYYTLPRRETGLHPLIRAVFVANGHVVPGPLRELIDGWVKLTPNPLGLYVHPMHGAWPVQDFAESAFPALTLQNVVEGIRFCREKGIVGFITDAGNFRISNTISHGLLAYAYGRWLWNADLTPDEIISDFAKHGFGEAAGDMTRFFKAVDSRQMSFPRENGKEAWFNHHLQVFTPEFVAECMAYLSYAAKSAKSVEDRARVELYRQNLLYTSAEMELERVWRRFNAKECDLDALREAYRHCEVIYEALPPETKPQKPVFKSGDAVKAALLAESYKSLEMLPFTDWELCADPFNEGISQAWYTDSPKREWRKVPNQGYDAQGLWGSDVPVWYRIYFNLPNGAKSEKLKLAFAVNNTSAELFMNGRRLGAQLMGEAHYREPELGGAGELISLETTAAGIPVYDIGEYARSETENNLMVRIMGYTDRGVFCHNAWLMESH